MVAGFAVGAAVGILLAPESGEKTRQKLLSTGQDFAADLRSKFDEFLDEFINKIDSDVEEETS